MNENTQDVQNIKNTKNIENNFYIISFNYKHLPLEEREKFIKNGYKEIIDRYKEIGKIKGYVAVETCLRVELYLDVNISFDKFNMNDSDYHNYSNYDYKKYKGLDLEQLKIDFKTENMKVYNGNEAIEYLLKVICGLESIIKGEDQILSQLKKAYFLHLENEKTSTLLNIIFNQAIETGKKFRSESKINEKNLSLDSIAIKFIKTKFDTLENKKIFIIGVGELSQSILALLHKMDNCDLTMTNRSDHRSIEIQKLFNGVKVAKFNEKYDVIKNSDIIISATAAPHLVVEKEKMIDILEDGKRRFFLDLAVPRDIDQSIGEASNISLYHLEDIWEEYNKNIEKRDEIIKKYFYIIEEQLEKIHKKIKSREKYMNIEVENV